MCGRHSALLFSVSEGKGGTSFSQNCSQVQPPFSRFLTRLFSHNMLQWYIGSQEMVPGRGFTVLLSLMWSNVLYLDLGKHHDPKSAGHQMEVVPLALAGAVSGGVDLASMEPGFCWW